MKLMVTRLVVPTVLCLLITLLPFSASAQRAVPKKIAVGDGISLHYVERGSGEPVIFVHPLNGDYTVWQRQLEAFAARGYRAIAYSRRYNFPNTNERRPNHSAVEEAVDLAGLINALDLEKAHVVGHSYGAYTALMLALNHPALLRSVTLAEPPVVPLLVGLPAPHTEAGEKHRERLFAEGVHPANEAFEAGNDELGIRTLFDHIAGRKGAFDRLPPFVKARCRRNVNEMKALVASEDIYPDVSREHLSRLKVPTLILSGSESIAASRFSDPELVRLIPEDFREQVILPGASHIMWIEQPVQSRNAVLEFIRGK